MSGALFTTVLKANVRTMFSYAFGMLLYLWLFIWVYPSFAGSQALNTMLQQLPQGLLKVLGYTVGMTNLSDFLGGEFYSLLYLIVMAIYCIFIATKLISHMIENGSMAYLLATPASRTKVAVTQALVLLAGLIVISLVSTIGALAGANWFIHNSGVQTGYFIQMNIVGILLFAVVAGYCFVFSCFAPDERSALSLSAVLTICFYVLHTVGTFSSHLNWLNHLSLFTAFDPQRLIHGQGHFALDSISLAAVALALFAIAIVGFRKRQLSL